MPKFLTDRRATSSLEYAVLAAVLGVMLIQVLRVPAQTIADVLANVLGSGGLGGGGGGSQH
jgi:Flp pilus assembly pilin Flp